MRQLLTFILFSVVVGTAVAGNPFRPRLNLSGEWQFALDPNDTLSATSTLDDSVTLPGTTDTNQKGFAPQNTSETTHLTRLHSYVGKAWYRREVDIPQAWKGQRLTMVLERTKPSVVFIDGVKVGESDDICTPQQYDLSQVLTPGRHVLTLMVDNGETVPPQLLSNSHAYTEDTQTNWNGIIGEMYIEAAPRQGITSLDVSADALSRRVEVVVALSSQAKETHLRVDVAPLHEHGVIFSRDFWTGKNVVPDADGRYHLVFDMKDVQLWDEYHPTARYALEVTADDCDALSTTFGFIDFRVDDHHFLANGKEVFLRGKHDACVFPLNAHVPMTVQEWKEYLSTNRTYGINHIRFHSWCPPEAAFEAADQLGIYLQPELPFWGDFNKDDQRLMSFLHKEGEHIIRTYGHHPSFVMFALGNELWGSIEKMAEFVGDFRAMAPKKLFTFGSNYYLGYQGVKPGMDYFTTCRVGGEKWGEFDTHTRGSFSFADTYDGGIINHSAPGTVINFEQACARSSVPVISHETAQFQTYPDFDEIHRYTGVLYPYNMQVFYKRLVQAGMAGQAKDFHRASGLWSLELYKADVEMDMRTPNMAGFQLLDLQDYPGQGSAYVGVLDAFMKEKTFMRESKGTKRWQSFCNEVVPLLETERFCYTADETMHGHLKLFNYSSGEGDTKNLMGRMEWTLLDERGKVLRDGYFDIPQDCHGLTDIGDFIIDFKDIDRPERLTLSLLATLNASTGTDFENSYAIWVYPQNDNLESLKKGIIVTHEMDAKVMKKLERGARVLWMPDTTQYKDHVVGGLFQTDYWNYRMFKTISENNHRAVSPGTLGILTDPQHPVFADFPTEMHTNWQWFPVVKASTPMILDNLPADYRPIVQVIDNIERNHRLGMVFEFAVGKGRLLVCMSDLERASERVEGRQFYLSLLRYMHSDNFRPTQHYRAKELLRLLQLPVQERQLEELNNISPY